MCSLMVALAGAGCPVWAAERGAAISVIIDDIGYRDTDAQALTLPSEVTFSILPHTPLGVSLAKRAHAQSREVMLHLPMAAVQSDKPLGPGAITSEMAPNEITQTLDGALRSVPFAIGVNNHMGSELTTSEKAMAVLMAQIKRHNLFFVDSRTTSKTVAQYVADTFDVPNARRHVFLDHQPTDTFMRSQWQRLKHLAKRHGHAIVIAHPHPESLAFLQAQLIALESEQITLRPISHFFYKETADTPMLANKASLTIAAPN